MTNTTAQDRVIAIIKAQQVKGFNKYGKTVEDANLSDLEWIQHTQEELADAMIYLEMLKGALCKIKPFD